MSVVYLVRHGQTTLNEQGRFRGREDPPLDEIGLEESELAADNLRAADLMVVYTSPLSRASQTAEAIAATARVDVRVSTALIDLDYGDWQGLTSEEAYASHPEAYARFLKQPLAARIPGGESVDELRHRVLRFLEETSQRHLTQPVAMVTHEIPLRVVLADAEHGGARFWDKHLPTGSIHRVALGTHGVWLEA